MHVLEAIRTRRTIRKFNPRPVEREKLEQVLEAAVWAPNHNDTEPWHFYVVTGEAKARLADLRFQQVLGGKHPPDADPEEQAAKERDRMLAAGAVIGISADLGQSDVMRQENYAAVSCAIQNLMLAATALGLGALWRTGGFLRGEDVRSFLGLPATASLVGLILLGYPGASPTKERTPAAAKTTWIGAAD